MHEHVTLTLPSLSGASRCEQRSRVDFGDDGSFNEQSNRHSDLLHKMLILVQVYLEIWYPTLERLQSGIQKRAKKGLKVAKLVKMNEETKQNKQMTDMIADARKGPAKH